MTKYERRRAEEDANKVPEADEARRKQWCAERATIISLFEDELPNSIDSLCHDHYAGRATKPYGENPDNPAPWTYLIDDRAVNESEHLELCQILRDRLTAIVDWCVERQVGLNDLVVAEIKRTVSLKWNQHVHAETELKKSRTWLLEIVLELAAGATDEVLSYLMQCWVRLPVKQTLSFLLNTLLETQFPIRSESAQDRAGAVSGILTDTPEATTETAAVTSRESQKPAGKSEASAATPETEGELPGTVDGKTVLPQSDDIAGGGGDPIIQRPKWDPDARKLSFRGKVRKFFPQIGKHAIALLNVFEECGWRYREDNPIDADASSRALRTLNNSDLPLRFKKDGEQIEWVDTSL